MPQLEKAELIEIEWNGNEATIAPDGRRMTVQFNPESLAVSYSNEKAGGDQRGGSAMQYVGQGTTTLALDLWFDVNAQQPEGREVDDVRELTGEVVYFVTPVGEPKGAPTEWKIPAVRFLWGSFLFDGVVDTLNETLDFFSEDGRPLRAMVSVSLTSQQIQFQLEQQRENNTGTGTGTTPGARPLTSAAEGQSLQQLAAGLSTPWQDIARANGIENPRQLGAGTLLNLNAGASLGTRRR